MMKSYKEKISGLKRCNFRMGDEHVAELVYKWGCVAEDNLSKEDKRLIDSYYYRYRRQVLLKPGEMNLTSENKRLCKLGFWEFFGKLNTPVQEDKPVIEHVSRNEWERRKRVMQLTIFN